MSETFYPKIPDDEKKQLQSMSRQRVVNSDPSEILDALRIDYKTEKNGNVYIFKSHSEKTASSRLTLMNDGWIYHNFATGDNGTVIDLVNQYNFPSLSGASGYHESINYCYENISGAIDYYGERLKELQSENEGRKNIQKRNKGRDLEELERMRLENATKAQESATSSRIISVSPIYKNNEKALEYLKSRGIKEIPKYFYNITGEYETINYSTGEVTTKKRFGIGVITGNPKELNKKIWDKEEIDWTDFGADIHFINPYVRPDGTSLKTMSFGVKGITFIPSKKKPTDALLVTESKMDYGAGSIENLDNDFKDNDVCIANGTGSADKIIELIKTNMYKKVINYNQNDLPAVLFIVKILHHFPNIKEVTYFDYKLGEEKDDINDLVKKKIPLYTRKVTTSVEVYIDKYIKLFKEKKETLINQSKDFIENSKIKKELTSFDDEILEVIKKYSLEDASKHIIGDVLKERFNSLDKLGLFSTNKVSDLYKDNKGLRIEEISVLAEIEKIDKSLKDLYKTRDNFRVEKEQEVTKAQSKEPIENKITPTEDRNNITQPENKETTNQSTIDNKIKEEGHTMGKETVSIQDFKKKLLEFNINYVDLPENMHDSQEALLDEINEYARKNKKNKELVELMKEWVTNSCRNNNKDSIDRAKPFIFEPLAEILDTSFKYMNIGKNLNSETPAKTTIQEATTNKEKDDDFEIPLEIIETREEEIKISSSDGIVVAKSEQVAKEEFSPDLIQTAPVKQSKATISSDDNYEKIKKEMEGYSKLLLEAKANIEKLDIEVDEKFIVNLKGINNTVATKKVNEKREIFNSYAKLGTTIKNRLKSEEMVVLIKVIPNVQQKEEIIAKRKLIFEDAENVVQSTNQNKRVDCKAKTTDGLEIVEKLKSISSKLNDMVLRLIEECNELKKNIENKDLEEEPITGRTI